VNDYQAVESDNRDSRFVRLAGAVADLGNPFYREERQRDVWNEASAVGLQLMLWLGLAAAAAMVWFIGAAAMTYAAGLLAMLGIGSWVSVLYAQALGVRVTGLGQVLRLRLIPYLVLLLLFVVGALRAVPRGGFGSGFAGGVALGGGAAVLWLTWSGLRARRRFQDGEL
jgi:hypothetical protein